MSALEISKRYAKALMGATKEKGNQDKVASELVALEKIFSQDQVTIEYFANPLISTEQKKAVIQAAISSQGVSAELSQLLLILAENGRLALFSQVVGSFSDLLDQEQGVTRGIVRSAKPLSADVKKSLEEKLSTHLKKRIVLSFKEDPSLLGGLVAQVGGLTFDDSLNTHLNKLNDELNRRAK